MYIIFNLPDSVNFTDDLVNNYTAVSESLWKSLVNQSIQQIFILTQKIEQVKLFKWINFNFKIIRHMEIRHLAQTRLADILRAKLNIAAHEDH